MGSFYGSHSAYFGHINFLIYMMETQCNFTELLQGEDEIKRHRTLSASECRVSVFNSHHYCSMRKRLLLSTWK